MNSVKIIFLLLGVLLLSGCEGFAPEDKSHREDHNVNILDVEFEPDYKYFYANVQLNDSIVSAIIRGDSTIRFEAREFVGNHLATSNTQPRLIEIKNIKLQEIRNLDLNILVLVDLTLDPEQIAAQRLAVKNMKALFSLSNMHVAFMKNRTVSETMNATDYVLDNYFKPDPGEKYLYRSILCKLDELVGRKSRYFPEVKQDTITRYLTPRQEVLVVLSDGKVYEHDMPIDPEHYALQRAITQYADSIRRLPLFYVSLGSDEREAGLSEEPAEGLDNEAENLMRVLCAKMKGQFLRMLDPYFILNDLVTQFHKQYADFRFLFVNPDLKIYRGLERILQIDCFQSDSLIATDVFPYSVGSIYSPVIVHGATTFQIILRGGIFGVLIILLLFLVFQLVIPAIRYWLFKRKYVTRYTRKNMTYNGILVEQSCYFCKAPFEEGDEIVVKCQHVLHKSCWDENEYKCPEYGRHCKQGSHYYNQKNLFDPHNASFYLSWILAGALAGLVAWICFTANAHGDGNHVLVNVIHLIFGVDANSDRAADLMRIYGNHLYFLPFYGLNIGFFLTLSLSLLTSRGRWWGKRSLVVVVKSLVGGLLSYLSFFLGCVVSIALNLKDNTALIDWLPWMLSGFIIAFVVAYGTDIKLRKALVGATISIIFGLGSMYSWSFAFNSQFDTREFLLLSYMIYCIGFAVSVAVTSPKSERYFLRVEGPIKTMDIAIYKWMSAAARRKRVLIGKSVNCELQMSWDLTSPIAPEQAEIRMVNGNLYLIALEEGVYHDKKPLRVHLRKRLYHGFKFSIGKTQFTYIEKDL